MTTREKRDRETQGGSIGLSGGDVFRQTTPQMDPNFKLDPPIHPKVHKFPKLRNAGTFNEMERLSLEICLKFSLAL